MVSESVSTSYFVMSRLSNSFSSKFSWVDFLGDASLLNTILRQDYGRHGSFDDKVNTLLFLFFWVKPLYV